MLTHCTQNHEFYFSGILSHFDGCEQTVNESEYASLCLQQMYFDYRSYAVTLGQNFNTMYIISFTHFEQTECELGQFSSLARCVSIYSRSVLNLKCLLSETDENLYTVLCVPLQYIQSCVPQIFFVTVTHFVLRVYVDFCHRKASLPLIRSGTQCGVIMFWQYLKKSVVLRKGTHVIKVKMIDSYMGQNAQLLFSSTERYFLNVDIVGCQC